MDPFLVLISQCPTIESLPEAESEADITGQHVPGGRS